mmetsp:Transcript_43136/g.90296  ORF Transcript_43136/g.90296 Transcript_43136/m.90296 type:complete len:92 (-) Transcript_43136:244-519(-)
MIRKDKQKSRHAHTSAHSTISTSGSDTLLPSETDRDAGGVKGIVHQLTAKFARNSGSFFWPGSEITVTCHLIVSCQWKVSMPLHSITETEH